MESECKIDGAGNKRWYNFKGQLHREDGPAVEYVIYPGVTSWYINGRKYKHINEFPLSLFLVYIKYHLKYIIKS